MYSARSSIRTRLRRMHAHQMNTVPAIVAKRKTHLSSGSGGPPSAACQNSGARNRLSVAAANPPIHSGGNSAFITNVWAEERVRGNGFIGCGLTDGAYAAGDPPA